MQINNTALNENGIILHFDKPKDWSSFRLVKHVKYHTKVKKVGHAGTLDPLATGVVIVCLGKATKQIESLQGMEKIYTGIITLGATTPCFDLEQAVDFTFPTSHITEEMIHEATKQFVGEIFQTPPAFSAVKVGGKRAYALAREGETPKINPKLIEIKSFEITKIEMPDVHFKVTCGKGTYIRSLARDFGIALQSGAHLKLLRREAVGAYNIDNCIPIEELDNIEFL